eukprot:Gregarina_sp_Pseudo_9__3310@NODE_348_length_3092_cov_92_533246_g72_i1_p2_GENE_NODE_348_length_3092_cov_92_533246_g72_i1NODE_348_length_3092_cov_92_533246_g72_i1_p2_ORF_typecomplete_len121_score22_71C2/PF00168_30/1_6e12_NODE_348_length_3092_cov_92_533246_g72_i1427789
MQALRVTVISAYNMPKKAGLLDKLDPYIVVQVGGQKQQTSAKTDAGSEAQYNETLNFSYNGEPYMMVYIFDEQKRKDTEIGSGRLELTHQVLTQGWRGVVNIADKKEKAKGEVLLLVQGY